MRYLPHDTPMTESLRSSFASGSSASRVIPVSVLSRGDPIGFGTASSSSVRAMDEKTVPSTKWTFSLSPWSCGWVSWCSGAKSVQLVELGAEQCLCGWVGGWVGGRWVGGWVSWPVGRGPSSPLRAARRRFLCFFGDSWGWNFVICGVSFVTSAAGLVRCGWTAPVSEI